MSILSQLLEGINTRIRRFLPSKKNAGQEEASELDRHDFPVLKYDPVEDTPEYKAIYEELQMKVADRFNRETLEGPFTSLEYFKSSEQESRMRFCKMIDALSHRDYSSFLSLFGYMCRRHEYGFFDREEREAIIQNVKMGKLDEVKEALEMKCEADNESYRVMVRRGEHQLKERMLYFQKKLELAETPSSLEDIQRIIDSFDRFVLMDKLRQFGDIHRYWRYNREILHDDYGIEWNSPADLNPDVYYD